MCHLVPEALPRHVRANLPEPLNCNAHRLLGRDGVGHNARLAARRRVGRDIVGFSVINVQGQPRNCLLPKHLGDGNVHIVGEPGVPGGGLFLSLWIMYGEILGLKLLVGRGLGERAAGQQYCGGEYKEEDERQESQANAQ